MQKLLLISRGNVTLFAIILKEINSLFASIDFQKQWPSFVLIFFILSRS